MESRLEKFQIIFNNPTATYHVSDTVYGYGWVILKEPIFVQSYNVSAVLALFSGLKIPTGVCLEAIGEAKVEWMTSSDIQASDEEVFNYTTVLPIKGDKDCSDDLLHAGSHYFPFEFTLPAKLPSSFKGKHGRLRYYVRMTITTPGGPHHERTSKFALPVENDTFEAIGSWCCVAGTVTATLRLDKKGFAIKEAIPVWAEIKNLSTRRICSTQVSLIQLSIKPAGIARKVKLPLDIVIGTVPVSTVSSPRTSYHPLPSTVSDNTCPYPFFEAVCD
ncbi:ARRD2-like protein, partial [Mya arenaria]